jgi:hypothetical protein
MQGENLTTDWQKWFESVWFISNAIEKLSTKTTLNYVSEPTTANCATSRNDKSAHRIIIGTISNRVGDSKQTRIRQRIDPKEN